jgi:hypothetical protein
MCFYNGVWLVANDIIFGVATSAFLLHNQYAIARLFSSALEVGFHTHERIRVLLTSILNRNIRLIP